MLCFSYTYSVLYLLLSSSYLPTNEFYNFFLMLTVLLYLWVVFGKESSLFLEALLVLFTLVLYNVFAVGYDCKLE